MAEPTTVEDEIVVMDYGTYENVTFKNCKIVYRGGRPPTLIGCLFDHCEWIFEGPAQNTVDLLRALATQNGGEEFVIRGVIGIGGPVR